MTNEQIANEVWEHLHKALFIQMLDDAEKFGRQEGHKAGVEEERERLVKLEKALKEIMNCKAFDESAYKNGLWKAVEIAKSALTDQKKGEV